ncbi:para-aminobenzoate synthetase / 4-amino-4-deoxychorismate lyase [Gammaproteobacteria bacterium]
MSTMGEALLQQSATGLWLYFQTPLHIIEARAPDDVLPALREIEYLVQQNYHAVGFVSYEAAPGFDNALQVRKPTASDPPLLYFTLYAAPEVLPASKTFLDFYKDDECDLVAEPEYLNRFTGDALSLPGMNARAAPAILDEMVNMPESWLPSVDRNAYGIAIDTIRRRIAAGDTYQVNYTWRLIKKFTADPKAWFKKMVSAQCSRHAAYLDIGQFVILSVSPELFFTLNGRRLITRPMKGTAARAPEPFMDTARAVALRQSIKNRAENLMIVDMMRNDLGRITVPGSVQVSRLFEIEQYPTVWQMTSTVETLTDYSIPEIFRALFPAASVTGAPKVNTMKIIADLETTPRGLYTGAIGFIAPGRRAEFNVAIRTVVVNRVTESAQYGVGSGIVWDSGSEDEYAECLAKTRVLWETQPRFSLLETLLWTPTTGFFLLNEHIERIVGSANYFGYRADPVKMCLALDEISRRFSNIPQRVRLLLDQEGTIHTEATVLEEYTTDAVITLAEMAINSSNPFFYHKTTHRVEYERACCACPKGTDVLLWNERGEITETTTANVVVEFDNERVTPPVSAGLLAGTYRRTLLEKGEIREKTIKVSDLSRAKTLWVINSLRGWRHATILHRSEPRKENDPSAHY